MLTDARLTEAINMLPECNVVADIGCDHGRLGAALLIRNICREVWLSDISAPSLEKARKLISDLQLNDRASFYVGNGALALPASPDCAVIAGMGGVTISEIIEQGKAILANSVLLLQPNVGTTELRLSLGKNGFRITDERIVRAAGRWYVLIKAEAGKETLSEKEAVLGPVLMKEKTDAFLGYAAFRSRVSEKALAGARKSEDMDTQALEREASYWREMLK